MATRAATPGAGGPGRQRKSEKPNGVDSLRAENEALKEKVRRLETYVENVNKQTAFLGNELALSNCVKLGIVEPFFTADHDCHFTYANESLGRLVGKELPNLVNRPCAESLRFDEPEVMQAVHEGLVAGKPATGLKGTFIAPDGRNVRVLINAGPLRKTTKEIVGLYGILQDISEIEGAEKVKGILALVREAIVHLSRVVSDLLATASQQNASMSEQSAAISETTATIKEINQSVQHSAEHAQKVIDLAERTSVASADGARAAEEALASISAMREKVGGIAESVVELSEQAWQIGEIVTTVNELAEQTNMLALNASIEAAKAGDYGKGFAVVAVEMRKLAEHSKRSTQQIRTILSEISKVIQSVVRTTEEGSAKAEEGGRSSAQASDQVAKLISAIDESSRAAKQIAVAARQQSIGFEQVTSAMSNITQATSESAAGIKQLDLAVRDLKALSDQLGAIVKDQ